MRPEGPKQPEILTRAEMWVGLPVAVPGTNMRGLITSVTDAGIAVHYDGTRSPMDYAWENANFLVRDESAGPVLRGDLSKLSAREVADQIREACTENGLRVEVTRLSATQGQNVVRVFDGETEIFALYPAGTNGNITLNIALPKQGTSMPLKLQPLVDQITGMAASAEVRNEPSNKAEPVLAQQKEKAGGWFRRIIGGRK